jgi:phosphoribosylaminoimidazolecarboxamide formyltransferase/IMP cyclohydrolase
MIVERALISVSDKTGIVEFAKGLADLGVEILSTGGTARALREAGLTVVDVSAFTGHPEMMDGRVKTLHPTVHGGILARRSDPAHMKALEEHGHGRIDLVAVNLYPFEETIAREGVSDEECIEQIDIGGPTLIRAAAKNHADVLVVTRPAQYDTVLEALRTEDVPDALRRRLALEAYTATALYDRAISRWFAGRRAAPTPPEQPEESAPADLGLRKAGRLRHGDNPWQQADLYLTGADREPCAVRAGAVGEAEPASLRELQDLDRALELVKQFREPAAAIVREGVPTGVALAKSTALAVERLVEAGALDRPGGALAVNEALGIGGADAVAKAPARPVSFIAPGYTGGAAEQIRDEAAGRIGRLLEVEPFGGRERDVDHVDVRRIVGGLVLQERDVGLLGEEEPRVVSQRQPEKDENRDLLFALACSKHATSCAAALAKDGVLVGLGTGRPDAALALDLALREAGERADGAVLAFDAPLGTSEGELLAQAGRAGVQAVIAPRCEDEAGLVAAADDAGLALVMVDPSHLR